jgi:aquaporin Z
MTLLGCTGCHHGFRKPPAWQRIEGTMPTRLTAFHWPEYLIEASAIGMFMMSAATFAAVLYHPSSPVFMTIHGELLRRGLMGLAMGLTAVSIIYSRWGQRSGAHMNPAVTLTFYRLGKVARPDLIGYVTAQFSGAVVGMAIATRVLAGIVSHPSVNYVTTLPGPAGNAIAFIAESAISFLMMLTVLTVSSQPRLARFTGICAGLLVWTYITFEAPLSGMSMNPARTLGSALAARDFPGLWIYFTAPPLGMLTAAELFTRRYGLARIACAKLHHPAIGPCIFGCRDNQAPLARTA